MIVVVDSVSGKVVQRPRDPRPRLRRGRHAPSTTIKQPIIDALDRAIREGNDDTYQLQQAVRRVVGRWVNRELHRRRPMIIPVVIEA